MTRPITSTYRLQFGPDMTFAAAAERVSYIADLGISHLYASPIFEARPGSTHGYDVADPTKLSTVLGGRDGFDELTGALRQHDLGLILDIVPNHMAASEESPWLRDVLEHGQGSQYRDVFDIDWEKGAGKLVLPILGAPLEDVVRAGDLRITNEDGRATLHYHDRSFPLAKDTEDLAVEDAVRAQHYELSYWRDLHKLNYRRFFDITDLIGVRQEDEQVFEKTHALIRRLVEDGQVDGLRIDHIDGLRDPAQYLARLAGFFPGAGSHPPIYVEKILEGNETLPPEWPARGETGYWFMGRADRLFTGEDSIAKLGGGSHEPHLELAAAKREVIDASFRAEFEDLAESGGLNAEELIDLAVRFPVYRTYLSPNSGRFVNERERDTLETIAKGEVPRRLAVPTDDVALRFQQMTGPVMAKSLEDTLFYRDVRMIALNEVGADHSTQHLAVSRFHEMIVVRVQSRPEAMNATSTHDTKRSEDARARLLALSRRPELWQGLMSAASAIDAPSERAARHVLQAAVAIWTLRSSDQEIESRLSAYIIKAEREAKMETSWVEQNDSYEDRLARMTSNLTRNIGERIADILEEIEADYRSIVQSRTALKLTVPGVPDTYQGTELEHLFLVDPDNRQTPRFADGAQLTETDRMKFELTRNLLQVRKRHPDLFLKGSYEPVDGGTRVIRFRRRAGGQVLDVACALGRDAVLPEVEGRTVVDLPAAKVGLGS